MRAGDGTKVDVWMPLYVGDWDSDTAHLTCEQDGAYGRIVRFYWRMGPPPDDDRALATIVRMSLPQWRKVRPAVAKFFQITDDGLWRHRRVDAEIEEGQKRKRKAVARAAGAAEARWKKPKPDARSNATSNATSTPQALLEQCPSPSPPTGEGINPSPRRERDAPVSPTNGEPAPAPLSAADVAWLEKAETRGIQGPAVKAMRSRLERYGIEVEGSALRVVSGGRAESG